MDSQFDYGGSSRSDTTSGSKGVVHSRHLWRHPLRQGQRGRLGSRTRIQSRRTAERGGSSDQRPKEAKSMTNKTYHARLGFLPFLWCVSDTRMKTWGTWTRRTHSLRHCLRVFSLALKEAWSVKTQAYMRSAAGDNRHVYAFSKSMPPGKNEMSKWKKTGNNGADLCGRFRLCVKVGCAYTLYICNERDVLNSRGSHTHEGSLWQQRRETSVYISVYLMNGGGK